MRNSQKPNPLNAGHRRVLEFKRVSNFRDLGGYTGVGSRPVRWGVLYRSGHLGKMRSADLKRFEALDIDTLIDFRSSSEREKAPNRLPGSQEIRTICLPIRDLPRSEMTRELQAAAKSKNLQSFDPSEKMMGLYRRLAVDSAAQYQHFVHAVLAARGKPVLWHCVAGKDRTGFAAAILLRILGVAQEAVLDDYLLSVRYADRRKALIRMVRLFNGKEIADLVQAFFLVQKEWIEAAFQSIDEKWGSFEQYSHEALDLSQEDIKQLRHFLLDNVKVSSQ